MQVDIKTILVPVDYSECSKAALLQAIDLAEIFDAKLDLLHVVWTPPPYLAGEAILVQRAYGDHQELELFTETRAREALEAFLSDLDRDVREQIEPRFVSGEPAGTIIDEAENADLVVLGTHGRTGFAHVFLGSVAEKVIRRAPCPVMTVREPGEGQHHKAAAVL